MVKRAKLLFTLLIVLVLLSVVPFQTEAAEAKQRIFDDAEVLTDAEINHLEQVAKKYSDKQHTDFIVLTTDEGEKDIKEYMGDFYDDQELGYDKPHGNAAIITIDISDPNDRDVYLSGFGKAKEKLPAQRLDIIRDKVIPLLSDGEYEAAFEKFITLSSRYMKFRDGANPANPFYNPWVQILAAILIGIVLVYFLARNPGMKTTVHANTYMNSNHSKVKRKKDQYIRTTVSKRRKPKKNNSSGGGRGGFGGGGGVTGGGRSFSGSRGKF